MTGRNDPYMVNTHDYRFGIPKHLTHVFKKHHQDSETGTSRFYFYCFNKQDPSVLDRAKSIIDRFSPGDIEEVLGYADLMGHLRNSIHATQIIPAIHVWQRKGTGFFEHQKNFMYCGEPCPGPEIGPHGLVAESKVTFDANGQWANGVWQNRLHKKDISIEMEISQLETKYNAKLKTKGAFYTKHDALDFYIRKNSMSITNASYPREIFGNTPVDEKTSEKILKSFESGLHTTRHKVADKANKLAMAIAQFGFTPTKAQFLPGQPSF